MLGFSVPLAAAQGSRCGGAALEPCVLLPMLRPCGRAPVKNKSTRRGCEWAPDFLGLLRGSGCWARGVL